MKIFLASKSKYKIQEIGKILPEFAAIDPEYDESSIKKENLSINQMVVKLAQKKALAVEEKIKTECDRYLIIGADQICHLNDPNEINRDKKNFFSKPKAFEKASLQLSQMSGRTHFLSTGVYVLSSANEDQSLTSTTKLTMRPLSKNQIENYLKLDEPFDCAGSYKIESHGINLFERIDSADFTGIIGIPLLQLTNLLRNHFEIDRLSL